MILYSDVARNKSNHVERLGGRQGEQNGTMG